MCDTDITFEKYTDRVEWRNSKGQYHRLDGPAIVFTNGEKQWWVNGKRHRLVGPAIECSSGYKEWWANGVKFESLA